MDITRFALPDGQWADIHRRPSHGQMKQITKWTQAAIDSQEWLDTEDALLLTLVDSWHVVDADGKDIPLKRESLDGVPQEIITRLSDELQVVTDAIRPDVAGADVSRRLHNLADRVVADPKDKAQMVKLAAEFDKIMGLSPNPKSQA